MEERYQIKGNTKGPLKAFFRNQVIFNTVMVEQTDRKALALIRLGSAFLFLLIVIVSQFGGYLHFPIALTAIPGIALAFALVLSLIVVKPNIPFIRRMMREEVLPEYPDLYHNVSYVDTPPTLSEYEAANDQLGPSHSLQIGNITRSNYIVQTYLKEKYQHLDWAYNAFITAVISCLILFAINVLHSSGTFHEHDERQLYAPYDFDEPSDTFVLPKELKEISGLAYDQDAQTLITHNDEHGVIYTLDKTNGEILEKLKFSGDGDYEAIEVDATNTYVITSNGALHIVNHSTRETRSLNTPFKEKNDIEGMHLYQETGQLLIATKGTRLDKKKKHKAIYLYNPQTESLDNDVFLDIDLTDLRDFVDSIYHDDNMVRVLDQKLKRFAPSGIAIHPATGDYYIITAHSSILLVYNQRKELKDIIRLNESKIPQPEGITFDQDQNLYISTEGQDTDAKIFVYPPID